MNSKEDFAAKLLAATQLCAGYLNQEYHVLPTEARCAEVIADCKRLDPNYEGLALSAAVAEIAPIGLRKQIIAGLYAALNKTLGNVKYNGAQNQMINSSADLATDYNNATARVPLARIPAHPIKWAIFTDGAARVLVDCRHVRQLLKLKKNKVELTFDADGLHCRWSATGCYNANANNYGTDEHQAWSDARKQLVKYVPMKYQPRDPVALRNRLQAHKLAEVMAQAVEVLLT